MTPSAHVTDTGMGVYYAGGAVWIHGPVKPSVIHLRLSYHLICFSVNTLCSLIITVRLIMHSRNIRKALGAQSKASGLYTVIVTTLIESSALYAVTYIPYIVSWVTRSGAQLVSLPVLAVAQVCVVFTFSGSELMMTTNRSSARSSSLYELPTTEH